MALVTRKPFDPHNGADYAVKVEIRDITVRADCKYCDQTQVVRLDPTTLHATTTCFKCESLFNIEVTGVQT